MSELSSKQCSIRENNVLEGQYSQGTCVDKNCKPRVSIIIPVYNVEGFLEKCLNSVINQKVNDIEIILIDDGSTDKSGKICDAYASVDNRIKVLHKANEGLSCARNDGIELSVAPYIMFIDSDDWIEEDFCELPLTIAETQMVDLVLFRYSKVDGNKIIEQKLKIQDGNLSEREALYYNVYYSCYAWSALYKRNLFESIRYPKGIVYEDIATTHRLIHAAKKIFFCNCSLYYYRVRRAGSITLMYMPQCNTDARKVMYKKIDDLCKWGYEDYAQKDALFLLLWYGCNGDQQRKIIEIIRRMHNNLEIDIRKRILIKVLKTSTGVFDILRRFIYLKYLCVHCLRQQMLSLTHTNLIKKYDWFSYD